MGEHWDARLGIAEVLAGHRKRAERIVFTNGCFDLLHPGHLGGLRNARALGDCLVVGINSDESVRKLKGEDRPIVSLSERVELLQAIRWVDHVVPFDEDTPAALLRALIGETSRCLKPLPRAQLAARWFFLTLFPVIPPRKSSSASVLYR